MTYEQWITKVEQLREKYINGELTPQEYYKAVMFYGAVVNND